jgi:hypothetical protein
MACRFLPLETVGIELPSLPPMIEGAYGQAALCQPESWSLERELSVT